MQIEIKGEVRVFKKRSGRLLRTSTYVKDVTVTVGEPERLRLGGGKFARRVTAYPVELRSGRTDYFLEKEIKSFFLA